MKRQTFPLTKIDRIGLFGPQWRRLPSPKHMRPARQPRLRLLLTLTLPAVLSLLLTACGNGGTELLGRLSEDEANTIISVLARADIATSRIVAKDGTSTIYVAAPRQAEALSRLHQRGLPRKSYTNLGEIFKKDGIISSPLEEQARYVYALAQELEDTLSQLDDVVYVRVHPVLARKASLSGPAAKASAGVLITHRPDVDLSPMVDQITQLVAHSIPDLDAGRVSVILAVSEETTPPALYEQDDVPATHTGFGWPMWLAAAMLSAVGMFTLYRRIGRRPRVAIAPIAASPLE